MTNPLCTLCQVGAGMEEGRSQREVAAQYGVGKSTVQRHRKHLARVAQGQERTQEGDEYGSLLEKYGASPEGMAVRGMTVRDGDSWVRLVRTSGGEVEHAEVDPVAILNRLEHPALYRQNGKGTFVLSLNDLQTGKAEGGGTPALIERVKCCVAKAQQRVRELRMIGRDIGHLVIIGGGDILEGCNIYPNQMVSNDLTLSEQIETALTLILYVIDQMAPMFESATVLATKGNHGENRVNGAKLAPRDNNDTMLFRLAQQATARDPRLQHINYIICAPEEESVWMDVPNTPWRLGTTHGDIYGKFVRGQNTERKAWEWYKNMAAGRFPIGQSDVLVTHHYHHEEKSDWGGCLWVQTRALDGGSAYFEQFSGQYSAPGMLTFVMTPDNRYQDEAIL